MRSDRFETRIEYRLHHARRRDRHRVWRPRDDGSRGFWRGASGFLAERRHAARGADTAREAV